MFNILWNFFFLQWIESSKKLHLFETEIFYNIINVFTVQIFDRFNVSNVWIKSIFFLLQKPYQP